MHSFVCMCVYLCVCVCIIAHKFAAVLTWREHTHTHTHSLRGRTKEMSQCRESVHASHTTQNQHTPIGKEKGTRVLLRISLSTHSHNAQNTHTRAQQWLITHTEEQMHTHMPMKILTSFIIHMLEYHCVK